MPENPAFDAIDSAVERLMDALERIATEHGSEAVDLAMMAYQVHAIRILLYHGVMLTGGLALLAVAYLFARRCNRLGWFEEGCTRGPPEDRTPPTIGESLAAAVFALSGAVVVFKGVLNLTGLATWLAALGSPEILVATNVLKSAGLM